MRGKIIEIGFTEIGLGDVHWIKPLQDKISMVQLSSYGYRKMGDFLNEKSLNFAENSDVPICDILSLGGTEKFE
jgi:hypothetical protein